MFARVSAVAPDGPTHPVFPTPESAAAGEDDVAGWCTLCRYRWGHPVFVLLLLACQPTIEPSPPPPPTLELDASGLSVGGRMTATVSGTIAGRRVYLVGALNPGSTCVSGGCVPLQGARLLATADADADGIATVEVDAPPLAVGTPVHLLALHRSPFAVSPVLMRTLADGEADCGDGYDEDGDGLVDCEDADCVDACTELDCGDAVDDDDDGFVDCQDDDCWAPEGPCRVSARVIGGIGQTVFREYGLRCYSGYFEEASFVAQGVEGLLLFDGPSGASSCSWGAGRVQIEGSRNSYGYTWTGRPIHRSGLWGAPGCPTHVLPGFADFDGRRVLVDNRAWYSGIAGRDSVWTTLGTCVFPYGGTVYQQLQSHRTRTFMHAPLLAGPMVLRDVSP